jgi:DNA (cytosine-5)-methyltransferase 1
MKVLSLFSGVGGFDLGLEAAGMETVFQCEWDKHATNILEKHWPHVPRWGDISTLTGKHILNHAPVIDVVAWGSPCQDLSVAGKRAGLEGSRSGLFHEGVRIIKELRKETNNEYPRISIWENVYGALNSNRGADFGVILNEMAEAGALVQEWRVLDAQYFGVPQRRRRVFLISIFDTATATRCPDPLLPVSEGVQWHPATSHTTRQTVAGETPASSGSSSFRMRAFGDYDSDNTASAIKARDHKDATDLVVEPPILIDRAAFNQGINAQYDTHISDDPVSPSLVARGPHAVATSDPVLLTMREGKPGGGKGPLLSTDKSLSLSTSNEQLLFTPSDRHGVVQYDGYNQRLYEDDVSVTIRIGRDSSDFIAQPIDVSVVAPSLTASNDPSRSPQSAEITQQVTAIHQATMAVRRLTPLECERLMGWPDDWTAGQSDTHRYKQCGNGVASPVAQWIAQQLLKLNTP